MLWNKGSTVPPLLTEGDSCARLLRSVGVCVGVRAKNASAVSKLYHSRNAKIAAQTKSASHASDTFRAPLATELHCVCT